MKLPTYTALAQKLGVTVKSLGVWKKLPGAPADKDLASWRSFIAEADLGRTGNRVSKRRELALARCAELRAEMLASDMAVRNGKMVERSSVNSMLLHTASQLRACLYSALEREYPGKVVGRTASEISLAGRDLADRLCVIMADGIETFTNSEP